MLVLGWSWCRVVARAELGRASSVPVGHSLASAGRHGARAVAASYFGHREWASRLIVPLAVSVQRLAREGQVCLAEGFALSGVGVDQCSDILGERVPVGDQLRL